MRIPLLSRRWRLLWLPPLFAVAAALPCMAQAGHQQITPQPVAPAPKQNRRLILKDGTYQLVSRYEVHGDRVRYVSVERGGEWEELPADLVDWTATKKWERDHTTDAEDASPAMREAAEIDKEEQAQRDLEKARMPEVAKGLTLPDEDAVFALDTFHGAPELIELIPSSPAVNSQKRSRFAALNPRAGDKALVELDGANAKVHLHVNDPAIYLSLGAREDAAEVVTHALTVDTSSAKPAQNRKHGAHSPQSGFVLVRVDQRRAMRIVGSVRIGASGEITQQEDVIPTSVEVVPGKHWLRVAPKQPLTIGEYALVEILSPSDISSSVWDFRVDPATDENPGAIGPIQGK